MALLIVYCGDCDAMLIVTMFSDGHIRLLCPHCKKWAIADSDLRLYDANTNNYTVYGIIM